ncbi:cell wall hydrolase [Altererythrobacter aquiaggeris]|uniref:cell wall hydrolase n=1 Tax=Aestuarierythrobacter aquiaggeris TaxID=1898396 RepID=UPI003018D649
MARRLTRRWRIPDPQRKFDLHPYNPLSDDQRPRDFRARLPRVASGFGRRQAGKHRGRRLAALVAAFAVPAMAAPGEWQGLDNRAPLDNAVRLMPFEKAGHSFPGSAFYYLDDDGVTAPARSADPGLAATDDMYGTGFDITPPVSAYAGPAARAFLSAGSGIDKSRALQCMSMAIYYEARSEADVGQRAVAQVVLNRVAHPSYPGSVCGVVFQGSERRTGCQFSFTCDGSMARQPGGIFWERARRVASDALAGRVYAPVGYATHYHTLAVNPYWASSLQTVGTIGFHRFYRWKGAAGTASAFRAAYNGREPLAAPAQPAVADYGSSAADPLTLAQAYEDGRRQAAAPASQVQYTAPKPTYSQTIEARGGDAIFKADKLPAAGGVRPEYANAGKWIAQPK